MFVSYRSDILQSARQFSAKSAQLSSLTCPTAATTASGHSTLTEGELFLEARSCDIIISAMLHPEELPQGEELDFLPEDFDKPTNNKIVSKSKL